MNKGNILPYTTGYIYELQILGKYRFYVEPEVRLTSDVVNAIILLGIAYISVTFASIVHALEGPGISSRLQFFVTMSVGTFYLAADELFGIHESLGHNMQFLLEIPGVHRPDDLIIAAYTIPALAFLYYFRSILLKARRPLLFFSAAVLLFVMAAIADSAASGIEEIAEIFVGILLLSGTISLGWRQQRIWRFHQEETRSSGESPP